MESLIPAKDIFPLQAILITMLSMLSFARKPNMPTHSLSHRRRVLVCTIAWAVLPAVAAQAELTELSLEELMNIEVTGASTYVQSAKSAPSAVTVVSRDDIRRFGWRTLQELLTAQRGFHGSNDRTYSYLGVRGFSPPGDFNNRILFLIDGIRVNDNIYDSVLAGETFPLDLDLIERVEIIRGPGASIYGGNALFGVINILTRSADSFDGGELALDIGSQGARRLRASAGKRTGDAEWVISASGFDKDGGRYEFPDVAAGVLSPGGADAEQQQRVFGRIKLGDWRATLIHSERRKHVPTGSFGTIPTDPGHREDDGYTLADLAVARRVSERHSYDLRLFAGQYRYDSQLPYDYSGEVPPRASRLLNRDTQRGQWWGADGRWTVSAWAGHKLVAGLEYIANTRQYLGNRDDDGTQYLNTDAHSHRSGAYLQDEMAVADNTILMLGVRHDTAETGKSFLSPRLALVHQLDADNSLKLLYGTAFRSPNAYERRYIFNGQYGNPDLAAETIRTLEGVWERRLGEGIRFTGSLYRYRVANAIGLDPATGININNSPVDAHGTELELERRWSNGAVLRGSYSGQFLRQNGQSPDNAPGGLWHLDAGAPLGSRDLYAGLGLDAVSRRNTNSGAASVDARTLANLTLTWRQTSSPWEVSAGIYNLFDRRYDDPTSLDPQLPASVLRDRFAQDGRQWRLKLTGRF